MKLIPIAGNQHYYATEDGHIYSHRTSKLKKMKPILRRDGYQKINIRLGSKVKTYGVHTLVALTFIPNPENKPEVNHDDGIKTNNHVDNLEWNTSSENSIHAVKNGLVSAGIDRHLPKKVYQFTQENIFIRKWESVKSTEKAGYSRTAISKCLNGKRKSHAGYIWKPHA